MPPSVFFHAYLNLWMHLLKTLKITLKSVTLVIINAWGKWFHVFSTHLHVQTPDVGPASLLYLQLKEINCKCRKLIWDQHLSSRSIYTGWDLFRALVFREMRVTSPPSHFTMGLHWDHSSCIVINIRATCQNNPMTHHSLHRAAKRGKGSVSGSQPDSTSHTFCLDTSSLCGLEGNYVAC